MKLFKYTAIAIAFLCINMSCKCIATQKENIEIKHFGSIAATPFPGTLELCGERVPLEIPEVRERAEREFYMLLQQEGQLVLYIKRAAKYFPIYEKILSKNNMPDDLKFLSVAESALYQSRSSKSAFGLWQFMEGTAKSHGLIVNEFVDERANVEKSTQAAVKYLKNGYNKFNSWALTLAGYNMGNAGIDNALSSQEVDNYYDLYLNEETSRFIFRIAIIKEFMKNAEKYGLNFLKEDMYSLGNIKKINVNCEIADIAKWAKENKTTYKDVKNLNPWILKNKLPAGNWEILVPVAAANAK